MRLPNRRDPEIDGTFTKTVGPGALKALTAEDLSGSFAPDTRIENLDFTGRRP